MTAAEFFNSITAVQLDAAIAKAMLSAEKALGGDFAEREHRHCLRGACMGCAAFRDMVSILVEGALAAPDTERIFGDLTKEQLALLLALAGTSVIEGMRVGIALAEEEPQ